MAAQRFASPARPPTDGPNGSGPAPGDRMVLSCTECPPPKPSRRRPPRWATVARTVAAAVGVPAEQLREALDEALKTEKDRKR